jgi:uncharacterized caspase-like protein
MLHAILIGIDKYRDPNIRTLSYAQADAEALKDLIEDRIHPVERQIHLLLNEEATKRNVMIAIGETLPRIANPEDLILLYFACHGSPETDASPDEISRYLVVHDTEYDNIYATGIDMERELPRWYERIRKPKLVLLFIDACFSGRAGGRTFEGPHLSLARDRFRQTQPISLKNLDLGEGRLMVSACDDNQVAREDSSLSHGVFTYFLLETLKRPEGNAPTISVNTLYDEVAHAVRLHTNGRQVPIINGRSRLAQLPLLFT